MTGKNGLPINPSKPQFNASATGRKIVPDLGQIRCAAFAPRHALKFSTAPNSHLPNHPAQHSNRSPPYNQKPPKAVPSPWREGQGEGEQKSNFPAHFERPASAPASWRVRLALRRLPSFTRHVFILFILSRLPPFRA
jgi:hypothetical protein